CQRADHELCPAEAAATQVGQDIADDRFYVHRRIDSLRGQRRTLGFELAFIFLAEKDRAAEVAQFDSVHVRNQEVAYAQQGQVFNNFISKRARADDKDACLAQLRLVPPFDGLESRKTPFLYFK